MLGISEVGTVDDFYVYTELGSFFEVFDFGEKLKAAEKDEDCEGPLYQVGTCKTWTWVHFAKQERVVVVLSCSGQGVRLSKVMKINLLIAGTLMRRTKLTCVPFGIKGEEKLCPAKVPPSQSQSEIRLCWSSRHG